MRKDGALWALGTMSGTSLDGVDAAMIKTDGQTVFAFGPAAYRPYTPEEQEILRRALGQWPGDPEVEAAAEVVETAHAEVLARFSGAEVLGCTPAPPDMEAFARACGLPFRRCTPGTLASALPPAPGPGLIEVVLPALR